MNIARDRITAGVLAGGRGRRLGGVDKGWYRLDGQPLITRTLARVAPQCAAAVISANRSLARYRALGHRVVPDDGGDFDGPLAGIAALLQAAATPYVLIVPVDTPALPLDLAPRLGTALHASADLAVASCAGRTQPLHALLRRELLADLEAARADGIRAVHAWHRRLTCVPVAWPDCDAFANVNAEADARVIAARL